MYRPELLAALGGRRAFLVETIGDVGASEQTAPIRDADDEAGWLDDVLDGLGLDRAHLVGSAFGGWLVLNHGLRSPDRVRSISGIEPVFGRIGLRVARRGVLVLLAGLAPGPVRRRLAVRLHQPLLVDSRLRRLGTLAFTRFVNGHPRPQFLDDEQLGAVTAPTLVLLGAQSELHDAEELARRLERAMPRAEVELVPDAGHSLPVEHPEAVGGRVRRFLDAVERSGDEAAG
jgi:pimeloyl-ACP methyl ester carboxylesterase